MTVDSNTNKNNSFLNYSLWISMKTELFFMLELSLSREVRFSSFGLTTPYFSDSIKSAPRFSWTSVLDFNCFVANFAVEG
jgi:hypothetical protein